MAFVERLSMTSKGTLIRAEGKRSTSNMGEADATESIVRTTSMMLSEFAEHKGSASTKWQITADDAKTDAFCSEMAKTTRQADKRRAEELGIE